MFCMNCGTELPDNAKFCLQCGEKQGSIDYSDVLKRNNNMTKLVAAQCTNCNAPLEVDSTKEAAICPFCNTPYIVSQAINNYNVKMNGNMNITNATINIEGGSNISNLLKRAERFEEAGDYNNALEYYDKELDIDVDRVEAQQGIERINKIIDEYVYFTSQANTLLTFGTLTLKRGKLIFVTKKGKETVFFIDRISNADVSMGCINFNYDNQVKVYTYSVVNDVHRLVDLINDAKEGKYPEMKVSSSDNDMDKYILEKFVGRKLEAIKYYREQTGADLKTAKEYIERLM